MSKRYSTCPSVLIDTDAIHNIIKNTHDDAWYGTLPLMGIFTFCKYLEQETGPVTVEKLSLLLSVSEYRISKLVSILVDLGLIREKEEANG